MNKTESSSANVTFLVLFRAGVSFVGVPELYISDSFCLEKEDIPNGSGRNRLRSMEVFCCFCIFFSINRFLCSFQRRTQERTPTTVIMMMRAINMTIGIIMVRSVESMANRILGH